jgi:hypothetical protein
MKFRGQRRKARGSRIKDNEGGFGSSLVPFAVRPAPDSYASFLGISEALDLDIFHQPLRGALFDGPLGGLNFALIRGCAAMGHPGKAP